MEHGWHDTWKNRREVCPSTTLSTTNPTLTWDWTQASKMRDQRLSEPWLDMAYMKMSLLITTQREGREPQSQDYCNNDISTKFVSPKFHSQATSIGLMYKTIVRRSSCLKLLSPQLRHHQGADSMAANTLHIHLSTTVAPLTKQLVRKVRVITEHINRVSSRCRHG